MSFWLRAFLLITSCFGSLFRHASHILESFPKMISLYLCCVSTIAFSRSSLVFIQFWRGIFNSFVSCNNFFIYLFTCNNLLIYLFIYLKLQYIKYTTNLFMPHFSNSKYTLSSSKSLNILQCWLSASMYLHSSTYTWGW